MFWIKFEFWLFTLMIPFISFIGYVNYLEGKTLLLAVNVLTVVLTFVIVVLTKKNINRIKKMEQEENHEV